MSTDSMETLAGDGSIQTAAGRTTSPGLKYQTSLVSKEVVPPQIVKHYLNLRRRDDVFMAFPHFTL